MSTCSVSKGCFVFKPNSNKRKRSSAADYFSKGNNDLDNSELRLDTCLLLWKQIKSETAQLQDDLNKNLFDNLIKFLRQSHLDFKEKKAEWMCRMKSNEIPTAAVVLGVNVTDHELTIKSLSEVLRDDITPFVVSLKAKECPGIKQLLQKLIIQLMGCDTEVDSSEEEECAKDLPRRVRCSVASLIEWYKNVIKKTDTEYPCKKRTFSSRHWETPPVVIIFKDMESFTTKVLQDFIIMSSHFIREFPLVLIFGIATSPMIIHKLLPHTVSSLLCIELFQSLSSKEHLTKVIDKLLLTSQFPFKISEKVLHVLTNIFLYHDFSVHNFVKGFQLSLLEHFYSHPLSVLCCEVQESEKRVQLLSHKQFENIRRLPSFRRFVESQEVEKQAALLTDDECLKETVQALLKNLYSYHENYFPILRCLHAFTSSLPKYPLGKQIRELYCACLEKSIWEREEYESAMQLVRMLAKDELVAILEKCVDILISSSVKCLRKTLEKLEKYVHLLNNLEEASGDQEKSISSLDELKKKTDLYHLQKIYVYPIPSPPSFLQKLKTLLEMKESRRVKKLTTFEILRFEIVDFIDVLVRNYLAPAEMQTLHEVMYFSAANTLQEHLNATPRAALHTALNNPYFYLKDDSLKCDAESLSGAAPDICIAYKLHLECGRLINLVDWLEAFSTVVNAVGNTDSTIKNQTDDIIHARFIRAVSELEFLGFIKPTKQKTDHVARLTWGNC